MCKVKGCNRKSYYKKQDVCQMHYFRFMRNGTYEKVISRKSRCENPAGYQLLYLPDHPLAQSGGYVYEHRKVVYDYYGENLPNCDICGAECSWKIYTTHIDHIDEDVRNNDIKNLRPLCNSCNSRRNLKPSHTRKGNEPITYMGETKTAEEWSREPVCSVSGKTIKARIKRGWSVEAAIKTSSKTIKKLKELQSD